MKLAFWKRDRKKESVSTTNDLVQNEIISKFNYNEIGITYTVPEHPKTNQDFYWQSLEEEDIAYQLDDQYVLPWEEFYHLSQDEEHQSVISLLNVPEKADLCPVIRSESGLNDSNFKVILEGWQNTQQTKVKDAIKRTGAILNINNNIHLLDENTWLLLEKIKEFSRLSENDKDTTTNQKYWAKIRKLALKSKANLDEFLLKTIVVAPEKIQLNLRKNLISQESVVEIQPTFDDAPNTWLNTFDQYNTVQDQYSVSLNDGGIAHIIIDPKVKHVLSEIKKMPNRRVAGERAHTFLHNPFAQLGEEANEVVSPESFEQAKREAKIYTYSIQIEKDYDDNSLYISAQLLLSPDDEDEQKVELELANIEHTHYFIKAYEKDSPVFLWAGYQIDRTGYLEQQIQLLKQDLKYLQDYNDELQAKQVLDLQNYGDRVIGIGEAQPLNANFIQKDSGESTWLPEHLEALSAFMPEEIDEDFIELLNKNIDLAEQEQSDNVNLPNSEHMMSLQQAQELLQKVIEMRNKPQQQVEDNHEPQIEKKKKDTLLIANNIDEVEYSRKRAGQLHFDSEKAEPKLPTSFRAQEFSLKTHQLQGIAWLQHLHQYAPHEVGGCLLADDMGLGKTLQLLCFIGEYLERMPEAKPVLVVAPVSLLENWAAEANKFFSAKFPEILSLYGEHLKARKIPKHLISSQLREQHGITNLLAEDWIGDAKIVLTTYETLRDLEFSLARQDWSIMVCDEAQKIKSPSAMVTKAAKAQKVDLKIACTGTPVENSLIDLWCLFDFIQENLLGSLSEFSKKYRKPIENKDIQDDEILNELRRLIEPQVLRRMKNDVAELPPKTELQDCKHIEISSLQRQQYADVVSQYKRMSNEGNQGAMLASLHRMRMICAHPLQFQPQAHHSESPKVEWLINTLNQIKLKNEKVIIFTEFREIQIFLKQFLSEQFGLNVTIVNGDSNTNSGKGLTRQKLIDKFQDTKGFNVIILSTSAVGFGVNVQKANHVIHYTRSWNPAKEDQATDRAYRIGQDKEVFVYYPSIFANDFDTFEIKLDHLLSSKRDLANDMLQPQVELASELLFDLLS